MAIDGIFLDSIAIPDWRNLLVLASRSYEMTGLGYIGTDLVVDRNRGPLLLELNARPGLSIQVANGAGLLPRLRTIEQLDLEWIPGPEERVDFSMEVFGVENPSDLKTIKGSGWTVGSDALPSSAHPMAPERQAR